MPTSREFSGDLIARMPASIYGLAGEYPLLDRKHLWNIHANPEVLGDGLQQWFTLFESARLWDHQENVWSGKTIQEERFAIETYAARYQINLIDIFEGRASMSYGLQGHFQRIHDAALQLSLGNVRLIQTAFQKIELEQEPSRDFVASVFSVGYEGLLSAAKKYNPWKSSPEHFGDLDWASRFSPYAVQTMYGYMYRMLHGEGMIRIPVHGHEQIRSYRQAYSYLESSFDRLPSHDEVVVATLFFLKHKHMPGDAEFEQAWLRADENPRFGQMSERYERLMDSQQVNELDSDHQIQSTKPVGEETADTFGIDLLDGLGDEQNDTVKLADEHMLHEEINEALDTLSEKERQVLLLRYSEQQSIGTIAGMLGTTEKQIKNINARALRRLSSPGILRALRDYYKEDK
jgi:RNA polymerase sigma factor (sigma-70 family)